MDSEAASASAVPRGFWVNIFEELSYSSHAIPPRKKYPKTKAKAKMTTWNASIVLDSLENIYEPEVQRQPKNLREVACSRMLHHIKDPHSIAVHFWKSGVPQSLVPTVPYNPELMVTCVEAFDPTSCSVSGSHLKLTISPEAIREMLCFPISKNTEVFSKKSMEEFWSTKRDALSFCQSALNRSLSAGLPKFPLSYSNLKQDDLKDISSTLAWLCGHDNDRDITVSMMGFLFKCRKQRESFHFDFSVTIAKAIVKQLSKFQQLRHFRFSSVLVHLLLHQNEVFFA